jgi:hypothetical protein
VVRGAVVYQRFLWFLIVAAALFVAAVLPAAGGVTP